MSNEIKKSIRKNIIKRKIQLYAFIFLGVIGLGLITVVILGILSLYTLLALIPIALMMYKNTQMWDLYNDVVILQKYIHDEAFRNEYKKEHLNN
jgi:hypothetical protein